MPGKKVEFITGFKAQTQTMIKSCHGNGISEMDWCTAELGYRRNHGEETYIVLDNKGRCCLARTVQVKP